MQRSWEVLVVCDKSEDDNSWQLTKAPQQEVSDPPIADVRFDHETDIG